MNSATGETYAIVRRRSDGQVIRHHISDTDPARWYLPWSTILMLYSVPEAVLQAIPADTGNYGENCGPW